MTVKTGQVWAGAIITLDSTGAFATPSAGPAGVLYVDGVADGATVTVTGANPYKWSVTLPSLTAGQRVQMYITATIAGVSTGSFVVSEQADTILVSDVVGADSDTLETLSDQLDLTALEATLTAMKGAGWTTETLKVIKDAVTNVDGDLADVFDDVGDVKAVVDSILADTNEVQAELVDGGRTDLLIDAIKAKTDNLPADPADDSDIDAQLAAIKAETALIVEDTGTTIPATITTIDNEIAVIDSNVDAILDDTGTTGVLLSTDALASIFDDETIVGTYTFSDLLKIMAAALAGKATGGGTTTVTFRGVDDTSDVIVATVDANGNRSAVTLTV